MNWKQILRTDVTTVLRGFMPPHVYHARRGRRWSGPLYVHRMYWRRDLMSVTAQLQAIVNCNAPLIQGLELAAWDAPRRKIQLVMQALRDDIASGMSLHEAMRQRSLFFPRYYINMIKVGEVTGSLSRSLEQLKVHLKTERSRASSIWGWIAYLSFVAFIQLVILLFIAAYVIPEFVEVLKDFGSTPPVPVRIMSELSATFEVATGSIRAILVALLFLIPLSLIPMGNVVAAVARRPLKVLAGYLPFVRTVIAKNDLGMVARVMERLLRAGIPINEALQDCADLEIIPPLQSALYTLQRRVEEGVGLSEAVASEPQFPDSFRALVSLGESSGKLPSCFERIADLYEQQTLKATRILVDTICPLGVLILGGVVLLCELSIFTSLIALADLIGMG